jgi:hypothetical protein
LQGKGSVSKDYLAMRRCCPTCLIQNGNSQV